MLILSRVCVEFRDHTGIPFFRVNPWERNALMEAPEAIREDPIFALLVAEGSLDVVKSEKQAKMLEADPIQGADASGKRKSSNKKRTTVEAAFVAEAQGEEKPMEEAGSETGDL